MYIEPLQEDRRKNSMPIERERRIDERLGILETKVDNHQEKLEENQILLNKFLEKFDEHIVEEITNTKSIEQTMIKVTNTVDNLTNEISRTNKSLETLASDMAPTVKTVNRWSTRVSTILKTINVIGIIIAAAWAVFTFTVEHASTSPNVSGSAMGIPYMQKEFKEPK